MRAPNAADVADIVVLIDSDTLLRFTERDAIEDIFPSPNVAMSVIAASFFATCRRSSGTSSAFAQPVS